MGETLYGDTLKNVLDNINNLLGTEYSTMKEFNENEYDEWAIYEVVFPNTQEHMNEDEHTCETCDGEQEIWDGFKMDPASKLIPCPDCTWQPDPDTKHDER